jgi:hypothetical protein
LSSLFRAEVQFEMPVSLAQPRLVAAGSYALAFIVTGASAEASLSEEI